MKTIQEYFREADIEELIRYYLYEHPVKIDDISDENRRIVDVKEHIRGLLGGYVERLRSIDIESSEDGKEYILFVHKMQQEGLEDDSYSLVCLQELEKDGVDAQTYSYIFDRQEKIMGFKVAETSYTQKHIVGLLVDVMHEASFFGFEQQHLDEELQKLEDSIKEVENGTAKTYSMDEVWEHLGFEREERDEKADELQGEITKAMVKYDQYQKKKELQALMDILGL